MVRNKYKPCRRSITNKWIRKQCRSILKPKGGGEDVIKFIDGWYYKIYLKQNGELWFTGSTFSAGYYILQAFGQSFDCSPVSVKLADDIENIWGDFSIHVKKKDDPKIYGCGQSKGGSLGVGDIGKYLGELKPVIYSETDLPIENIKEVFYGGYSSANQIFYLTNDGRCTVQED